MIVWCNECQTAVFSYRLRANINNHDVEVTAKCHNEVDAFIVDTNVNLRPIICVAMFGEPKGVLTALPHRDIMGGDDGVGQ